MQESVSRFCGLASTYHKYRPGYPDKVIKILREEAGLSPRHFIADIGSGTGLSCIPFLKNGNVVYGIEPNPEMRELAKEELKDYSRFLQLPGTAESPGMPAGTVDFVLVGQALHWFNLDKSKKSLKEITKKGGYLAIIWQERLIETEFMERLEQMIFDYSIDYSEVDYRKVRKEDIRKFFHPYRYKEQSFPYKQEFDKEGLKGRLLSCSYLPVRSDHPDYNDMINKIEELFDHYNEDGKVTIPYNCKMYYGQFK